MIVTMPGKLGDALYVLPTIEKLAIGCGQKITFWTSPYCEPLIKLFEYQDYIEKVVIDKDYVSDGDYCGVQPWRMINAEKEGGVVVHLGFRGVPDCSLPLYIMRQAGCDYGATEWDVEDAMGLDCPIKKKIEDKYIVLAPKTLNSEFEKLWRILVKRCKVVSVGAAHEYFPGTIDMTGLDFLETCSIIDHANAFVGTFSSMLALANFFNTPKIVPYDERWSITHGLNRPTYLLKPAEEQFLEEIEKYMI